MSLEWGQAKRSKRENKIIKLRSDRFMLIWEDNKVWLDGGTGVERWPLHKYNNKTVMINTHSVYKLFICELISTDIFNTPENTSFNHFI